MRFVPTGNRILVAPDIPGKHANQMRHRGYETGLVVEVGEGRTFDNGTILPTGFRVGQRVAYLTSGRIELRGLDQKYVLLDVCQVLGRIEENAAPISSIPVLVSANG